ncbi:hypothetical protein BJV78DRAFT_1157160 [Lactifluus subvellereus]|nr:hypothetical protein BJV78DRAFT_1157160 [Lactifluus subvellereus]
MFFLGIFPGFRLDPPFRVHEEPFQVTSKWGVTTPFSRGPHCSTCPYSPKNRLRTHPIESYNDTNNVYAAPITGIKARRCLAVVPEHPGESVTKGSAVDAPRKVPAPATGPAPEEQASTLVEGFKAATASALEASQAAWLGRARSARTQDCDPDPHGCHVGASYPLLSIHTSLPQIPMFLKHPDHLYIPHSELHGEPEHAQMVQEHADRPPTGPPQFLTRQKHKRWFNPLDALKKIFLSERKESKRKGWIVYLTTSFDHADQPATKASIVDPPRDDPTPVAGSAPEQASTLVKGFKVAVTSALEASHAAVAQVAPSLREVDRAADEPQLPHEHITAAEIHISEPPKHPHPSRLNLFWHPHPMVPLYLPLQFQPTCQWSPRQPQWRRFLLRHPRRLGHRGKLPLSLSPRWSLPLRFATAPEPVPEIQMTAIRDVKELPPTAEPEPSQAEGLIFPAIKFTPAPTKPGVKASESTDASSSTSAIAPASPAVDANTEPKSSVSASHAMSTLHTTVNLNTWHDLWSLLG